MGMDESLLTGESVLTAAGGVGGGSGKVVADGVTIHGNGTVAAPLSVDPGMVDAWTRDTRNAMTALAPALTRFQLVDMPEGPVSAPGVLVSIPGGAVGVASDLNYQSFGNFPIWPTPRTDPMGLAFRAQFPAIVSGKTSLLAIGINGGGANVAFGWDFGTSATKWVLFMTGAALPVISTFAADTNWHTFVFASDGAKVSIEIDGVVVATSTAVATLTNTPSLPKSFSSASLTPGVIINRRLYGWVDPV